MEIDKTFVSVSGKLTTKAKLPAWNMVNGPKIWRAITFNFTN